jgi:hypothetical protein
MTLADWPALCPQRAGFFACRRDIHQADLTARVDSQHDHARSLPPRETISTSSLARAVTPGAGFSFATRATAY